MGGGQDTGDEKAKDECGRGAKTENVEKMREARERGKTGCGQQNKKEPQQKEGRKHKESGMNGKDVRRERGSQEDDVTGCLHSGEVTGWDWTELGALETFSSSLRKPGGPSTPGRPRKPAG